MKFYMFRAVSVPIIRSLFTVHSALVYVIQVCRQKREQRKLDFSLMLKKHNNGAEQKTWKGRNINCWGSQD